MSEPVSVPGCPLCTAADPATLTIASNENLRIVRVLDAPSFPAFYRVIWRAHVAELSDLDVDDRVRCLDAVVGVERALREALAPTKINLASLGNLVPHLHWHVIARFAWDSHFPQPIWGQSMRDADAAALERLRAALPAVDARIAATLA